MELLYKRGEEERKKHLAAVRVLLYIFLPLLFLFFLCISVYSAALMEERQGILYYSCNDQCMYKVCCILCIKESSERKRRRADDDVVLKTTIKKKTKREASRRVKRILCGSLPRPVLSSVCLCVCLCISLLSVAVCVVLLHRVCMCFLDSFRLYTYTHPHTYRSLMDRSR